MEVPGPVALARRLADQVLFPAAAEVDRSDSVPRRHLDLLAAEGLYGLAGPGQAGGAGPGPGVLGLVTEALAGGCLATAFVWLQHHGLVRTLSGPDAPPALAQEWLAPLSAGQQRAGIALTGLHPGPPALNARPGHGGGWVLDGSAPWVTGWGLVDVLQVVARGPGEVTVWCLVDAEDGPHLRADRQPLAVVNASRTVNLTFEGLAVPADRVLKVEPLVPGAWDAGPALRANGSLALGVAGRCARLLGPGALDAGIEACRLRLDRAGPEEMAAARASASELAWRAAGALVVATGSRSVLAGSAAERLAREALFLLVFGSRAAIKAELGVLLLSGGGR